MTGSSTSPWTGLPAWWRSPDRRGRAERGRAGRGRRRGGFTLLEVLIAFTILAVALVALLRAFSSGLRGLDAAEAGAVALQHARSKIEEVGTVIPLEAGEYGGEFEDGTRWSVAIRPHEAGEGAAAETVALVPYEIEVTASRERGGKVTLRSLRLAPRQ
ncbi:MAG: prepilin-type N-terminal cleavage/methylation domain-containing protein [Proteobacteria bacterium]|nr:prepilin-type N-terminal cleavage/methylation domain-containing protein [Pseudomonadota bacterium]